MSEIIDGVDVSECDNLAILQDRITGKETFFCNCHQDDCSEQKNCYYKRLKRLEQENEQLKNDIETGTICVTCTKENENCRLQAENEELRQIRKDTPDIQQPYVIMYRNLKKELHNLQAENERLKEDIETCKLLLKNDTFYQALQEIREIVEEWINNDWSCFHCRSNMDEKLQDILDLIKAEEE